MAIYYKCIAATGSAVDVPLSSFRRIDERMYLGNDGAIIIEQELSALSQFPVASGCGSEETAFQRNVFQKRVCRTKALLWLKKKGLPVPEELKS